MRDLSSDRLAAAVRAIDAANAADPNTVQVRGQSRPLALAHGQLAVEWIERLVPQPEEELLLAARAHHLRRWELPRGQYPAGRAGYLKWKRDQRQRHAHDIGEMLAPLGYGDDEIARVQALVRRDRLATDPGAKAVEDAACLVFLETQLGDIAGRLDHDLLIDVIRKTAKKMSDPALAAVSKIPLGPTERQILADALG